MMRDQQKGCAVRSSVIQEDQTPLTDKDLSPPPSERPSKYIVVEYGMPHCADAMPLYDKINWLGVIQRSWEPTHVFDPSSEFRYVVDESPRLSIFAKCLAYTIYNPQIEVRGRWERVGAYSIGCLIAAVEKGLQNDDDIIQQWFSADDVLKLLKSAKTWGETLLAVEAIGGSHEEYPDVRKFVDAVLGPGRDK